MASKLAVFIAGGALLVSLANTVILAREMYIDGEHEHVTAELINITCEMYGWYKAHRDEEPRLEGGVWMLPYESKKNQHGI